MPGNQQKDNNPDFPFISFGPSDSTIDDAECITGVIETLQLDCWSRYRGGFKEIKQLMRAAKEALHQYSADLGTDALVSMEVVGLRVFRDPDGLTSHGVITLQAIIEEH